MACEHHDLLSEIERLSAQVPVAPDGDHAALIAYLEALGRFLQEHGGSSATVAPLSRLAAILKSPAPERRVAGSIPSDRLLAQVCAVVDILISAGQSADLACQTVTRQMIARDVRVLAGGDARAWRNLQAWRHRLLALKPEPAWGVYQAFKMDLVSDYGTRVAEAAMKEAIWDRRSGKSAA
jgi:hypothetical protein